MGPKQAEQEKGEKTKMKRRRKGREDRHTEYWRYLTYFGSLLALLSNLSFLKVWEENKYGPPQRAGAGFKKEKKFRKSQELHLTFWYFQIFYVCVFFFGSLICTQK